MPRLLLLFLVAFPLFSAEIPLSDVRTSTASEYTRQSLGIAGGDGFLLMWEEWYGSVYRQGMMVRAYDTDGVPLRPAATEVDFGIGARAVWTGSEYLVIAGVNLGRLGATDNPTPTVIVTRVQRDGTPVDAVPHRYVTERRTAGVASVAWNGTHVLAVIAAGDGRHLLRLDAEGNLVSDTITLANIVAVAPDGDDFFLLEGSRGVAVAEGDGWYAILGADGHVTLLDEEGTERERVLLDTRFAPRSMAYDGSRWFVAHLDEAQRLCTSAFGRDGKVTRNCRVEPEAAEPLVAASPRRTLTAWRRAPNQVVTDSGIASVRTIRQITPDSTIDAAGLLVVWREDYEIRIGGLRHDGTRRAEHVVATVGFRPRVVPGMVVWNHHAPAVRGQRLDAEGAPVGPVLELGPGNGAEVATTGDGWLVAYSSSGDVHLRYISPEGIVAGFSGADSELNEYADPVIGATATGYVVAWRARSQDIMVQRFNRRGQALSAPVTIAEGSRVGVGCNTRTCAIVWESNEALTGMLLDGEPRALGMPARCCSMARIFVTVDEDGTIRADQDADSDTLGGVETFRGRNVLVYTRDGRVYVRDIAPRMRSSRR